MKTLIPILIVLSSPSVFAGDFSFSCRNLLGSVQAKMTSKSMFTKGFANPKDPSTLTADFNLSESATVVVSVSRSDKDGVIVARATNQDPQNPVELVIRAWGMYQIPCPSCQDGFSNNKYSSASATVTGNFPAVQQDRLECELSKD